MRPADGHRVFRGFTLIELLVVIAVIGILSAIVLTFLNDARVRGSDAAVKKTLNEARRQAEVFYNANNGRYVGTVGTATDVCSSLADGSATDGAKGIYTHLANAADAAGIPSANIITSRTTSGNGRPTCHACPVISGGGACGNAHSNAWGIEVPLKSGGFWCVDSTGYAGLNADYKLSASDARCVD